MPKGNSPTRRAKCSDCGKPVRSYAAEPLCQPCRVKARTRPCPWCGTDFSDRDKNRVACSPEHGIAYGKWSRRGWSNWLVRELIQDCAPGMLTTNAGKDAA